MRKYVWLIGILIVAMLAVTFVAGCGKKQATSGAGVATAPGTTEAPAGGGANTLGDLLKKSGAITSYVMIMNMGPTKMRMAQKLEGGKPVAMKMDMGPQGWMLIQMDKKMQYTYSPATKSAMAMPMSASMAASQGGSGATAIDKLKALVGTKVSSETVDGVDCLKVVSKDGASTYWVEKENGLPVQMLMAGKTMKFKYEQINSVPDSEFEVPAGVKIQQMPAMPKMPNMPNMPGMPKAPK